MPALFITLIQRDTSRPMDSFSCEGAPAGELPSFYKRVAIAGECRTFASVWFQRMSIGLGMPFGPQIPYPCSTTTPGTLSLTVDTSGHARIRFPGVTARARRRPARTCGVLGTTLNTLTRAAPAISA